MTPSTPRLAFSHAEQRFIVKARSTPEGWEIRGFPLARGTQRTRFVEVVPHDVVEDARQRGASDPIGAALASVRDQMVAALNRGEQLIEARSA
jgi:hypothetical protein